MVRLDACKAAATIEPKSTETVDVLLTVVTKDASSNARCAALDAIACFTELPGGVMETIGWMINYCKDSKVVM
jgi:hypothetical protein